MIDIQIGNAFELVNKLDNYSLDLIITSPPFYAKRYYGGPTAIFDETVKCEHEWDIEIAVNRHKVGETNPGIEEYYKQNEAEVPTAGCFCKKCKTAWQGRLGNEPTPEMFLSHLWQFFELAKPKLKRTGSVYVNLGDSYWGSMQGYGASKPSESGFESIQQGFFCASAMKPPQSKKHPILRPRSLCCIPSRFAWGMVERGWILREDIIWAKGNIDEEMEYRGHFKPESVKNRLASAHEYIYHFVLGEDYYYNLDAIKIPIAASTRIRAQSNFNSEKCDVEKSYLSNDALRKYSDKILSGEVTTKNPGDVIFLSPKSYRDNHYATYSEALIKMPILSSCPENGIVLDPFSGSGSTGKFCRKNNRNAILFEINSDYRQQMENNTLAHTPELSKWFT